MSAAVPPWRAFWDAGLCLVDRGLLLRDVGGCGVLQRGELLLRVGELRLGVRYVYHLLVAGVVVGELGRRHGLLGRAHGGSACTKLS